MAELTIFDDMNILMSEKASGGGIEASARWPWHPTVAGALRDARDAGNSEALIVVEGVCYLFRL